MSNNVSCRNCADQQNDTNKFCDACGSAMMAGHWSTGAELRNALTRDDTAAWKIVRDVLAATSTKDLEAAGVSMPIFTAIQRGHIKPHEIPTAALDLVAAKHAATRAQQSEFTKAFRTKRSDAKPNVVSRRFQVVTPPSARWYSDFARSKNTTGRKVAR